MSRELWHDLPSAQIRNLRPLVFTSKTPSKDPPQALSQEKGSLSDARRGLPPPNRNMIQLQVQVNRERLYLSIYTSRTESGGLKLHGVGTISFD